MFRVSFGLLFMSFCLVGLSQDKDFTRQDTLRGTITKERSWWDLSYYHLTVSVDIDKKKIKGSNLIRYKVLEPFQLLQIELQDTLIITKVTQGGQPLNFKKDGYTYFIEVKEKQIKGEVYEVMVHYEGNPQESENPPWKGGVTWKTDSLGNPWVVTTCQGDGASLWWPNKDHAYDESDSMSISITVPDSLTAVSNGQLHSLVKNIDGTHTFNWEVKNPINNYGVNMNIGDYAHFTGSYKGLKGDLTCDYYVLRKNLTKATTHFKEVQRMFEAFEYWFGPYPFYEDGYKLVEVPYAGMEHQSSVTYGNGFKNGYLGRDLSSTGIGDKFDFIIIHESAHEWFANSITHVDVADLWIHESFASYAENLFVDYHYGTEACNDYVIGTRENILNDVPVVGVYNVHQEGSGDMYYKGSNMLHTLRQLVENDSLWRRILIEMNREFYHQTVTGEQVENYLSDKTGKDLTAFFDQYLRTTEVPVLEYIVMKNILKYRYKDVVDDFDMPLRVNINKEINWIFPNMEWQEMSFDSKIKKIEVDPNFYIVSKELE